MKDEAIALARAARDPAQKLNLLREYVQAMTLRTLHECEAFLQLAFVGGTALRFLYDLPRFSEDLDFSLHAAAGYRPEAWMKKLKTDLSLAGFDATISWNDRTPVNKAWIRIGALLHEVGLAAVPGQKLSIRLEIDTRPPAGADIRRTLVTRHAVLALRHYTLPSLMAGKVHALLTRRYSKGRDWYDLVWYRGLRPPQEPGLALLQNALDQTRGAGAVTAGRWRELLAAKLGALNVPRLIDDVQPFLEHPRDALLLSPENLHSVLSD